jgi:hypothetical protein
MNPLQFLAGYMDVANTLLLDNALATMGPGSFINWTSCSRPSTQYSGPLSPHTSAEAMVSACALQSFASLDPTLLATADLRKNAELFGGSSPTGHFDPFRFVNQPPE